MSQTTSENRIFLLSLHGADSVTEIGEFNNYSTVATPLKQINDDEWELQLPVNVDLERLGLFVIGKGEHSGHVVEYAELICRRVGTKRTACVHIRGLLVTASESVEDVAH
jgi:hypothetical protein